MSTTDFEFLYGTWAVHHRRLRRRLAGCTEWEEFDGTTICAPILGGVGNFEQAWMPTIGAIGSALRLFDPTTRQWSIHWSSNLSPRLDPALVGSFVGGVGTFLADDTHEGASVHVRFVWDEIADDAARWSQAIAPAGTDQWETNWVMQFAKVSDAAPAACR